MIVDLSAPQGASFKDCVNTDLCSLSYASVEQAAKLMKAQVEGPSWRNLTSAQCIEG